MILSSIRGVSSTRLPGEVPLLLPISHPPLDLEDYVNLTHKARNLHQRRDRVNRNFLGFPNRIRAGLALPAGGGRASGRVPPDGTAPPRRGWDTPAPPRARRRR